MRVFSLRPVAYHCTVAWDCPAPQRSWLADTILYVFFSCTIGFNCPAMAPLCIEAAKCIPSSSSEKNNHTAEGTSCGFVQGTRAKETALIKLRVTLCCQLVGCRQLKCMCVAIISRQLFYSTDWHLLALWPLHLILSIINVVHSSSFMEVSWYL